MLLHGQSCAARAEGILRQPWHLMKAVNVLQLPRQLPVRAGHLHPELPILSTQLI